MQVLQVATGRRLRVVPWYETTHRMTFYTNAWIPSRDAVPVPGGRLLFDTDHSSSTSAVTVELTERLEAVNLDGSDSMMVATSGRELLDDAAAALSFVTNTTWSRDRALVTGLVPSRIDDSRGTAAAVLRRTFDPRVLLDAPDWEDATAFWDRLLNLRRAPFEAVMRALRRMRDASYLVAADPTSAYTQLVAVLESLSQAAAVEREAPDWAGYDKRKRDAVDVALAGADEAVVEAVRAAVLANDALGLGARFRAFVLGHLRPEFFRSEASEAVRPPRRSDLPVALRRAYAFRSRDVHTLETLAPELWAVADRADTAVVEGERLLVLEGLFRLCRHLVRAFVDLAPTGGDEDFDYRSVLPGVVWLPVAPQYWIGSPDGYGRASAPAYLEGFVGAYVGDPPTEARPVVQVPDMSAVLERVEALAPAESPSARLPMVALYVLWHRLMDSSLHRPEPGAWLGRWAGVLVEPSVAGFAVRVVLGDEVEWTADEVAGLVAARAVDLRRQGGQPMPPRVDAALLLLRARHQAQAGRDEDALVAVAGAVESLPGDEALLAFEAVVAARPSRLATLDLTDFALRRGAWSPPDPAAAADPADPSAGPGILTVADAAEEEPPPEEDVTG